MKVGPIGNFAVRIVRESSEVDDQPNVGLYDGIYFLVLNTIFSLYFVPSFEQTLLTYEAAVAIAPSDLKTVDAVRAQTAVFASAVVTPHAELSGRDTEVTMTDVPESDAAFGDRTVKLLYVSPEEYAELDAEISRILEIVETPSGGKERERFDLENRLNSRYEAPRIEEIAHLKIGEFVTNRLLNSTIVDTRMLRDPE